MNQQDLIRYGVTIAVVTVILMVRVRRMTGVRPLKLETLWIVPALYLAAVLLALIARPPDPAGWLWTCGALALGAAIGWWRGSLMSIQVDPVTHALNHRASPLAVVLLVGIVLLRNLLNQALPSGVPALALSGAGIADSLLAFGAAIISVGRLEMFLRARRLLRMAGGRSSAA